jgi:tetratricopeptide (TPR) repeat protein
MTAALTLVAALSVPFASAQTTQPADQAASQQDPEQAKAEFEAYSAWYAAYKANDFAKTIELGEPFVQKFPNSKYTKFIRDFIPRARVQLFNQAQQQGNINEMIRRGREIIAADPSKEIDIVTALAVAIRQKELVANPPNFSHAAEATEFTKRTAELIEAGKIPTGADPKKFNETKGQTLGFLYQTLAMIEDKNRNNQDKALEYYVKAAQFEPNNPAYYFESGRIHKLK